MKPVIVILLVATFLPGCVSPQARRGMVVQAEVGQPFPNFTFQDERGVTQDLGKNLGDFTILVFSECGQGMHGPVSDALVDLVRVNQEPGYVETVGFDIHWSRNGCANHTDCHLLEGGPRTYSICDARAQVSHLYGVDSGDEIVIIGPERKIVSRASMADIETVSHGFADMFASHVEIVLQTRAPEE